MDSLDVLFESEGKLSGREVQIDETEYGHSKYYRGRYVDGVLDFWLNRYHNLSIRLEIIADKVRSEDNMMVLLKKQIELDSVIVSDMAKCYLNVAKHDFTEHRTVLIRTESRTRGRT